MKEVAAREQKNTQEPRLPDGFREIKDIQLFFETPVFLRFTTSHFSVALELPPYQIQIPDAPAADIFKPPAWFFQHFFLKKALDAAIHSLCHLFF